MLFLSKTHSSFCRGMIPNCLEISEMFENPRNVLSLSTVKKNSFTHWVSWL
ncbi:hypothetical protein M595_0520 [Lyngbya aestuarii BL J]|uniref:Uncharacterized protein n=1 Tax=Lyngbya aestuarii BL J TaxID=1348334 RepID=U7QR20_9CYAN|nr:hypothetical protein M595_0520 [Lyngbya aestuarii BL J]